MITGFVRKWDAGRGFGFITRDDGGGDIFAHISDVKDSVEELTPGQRVQFDEGTDARNGKTHAKNVELIAPIISPRRETLEDAEREFRSVRFVRSET